MQPSNLTVEGQIVFIASRSNIFRLSESCKVSISQAVSVFIFAESADEGLEA